MQHINKKIWIVSALLSGSGAAAIFSHTSWAQSSSLPASDVGRYQLAPVNGQTFIYMVDTKTGRCWTKDAASTGPAGHWQEDSPAWAKSR